MLSLIDEYSKSHLVLLDRRGGIWEQMCLPLSKDIRDFGKDELLVMLSGLLFALPDFCSTMGLSQSLPMHSYFSLTLAMYEVHYLRVPIPERCVAITPSEQRASASNLAIC